MTFAIIGYGTVGRATRAAAEFHGHECIGIVDPCVTEYEETSYNEPQWLHPRVEHADFAFVCVPTPPGEDGSCCTSIVTAAVADLEARGYQGGVVIRSTVPPKFMEGLALNAAPTDRRRFLSNPEFLRVRDAEHTSRWPAYVVIGGNPAYGGCVNAEQDPWVRGLMDFYRPYFEDKVAPPIYVTDYRTAAFYKYLSNALLAANVILADEAWQAAQALRVDWETCYSIAQRCPLMPKTIRVDPHDRGFGGACLPKDLVAFLAFGGGMGEGLFEHIHHANVRLRGGDR